MHWLYESQKVPCGKCVSCKLQKASEWAVRCEHESKFHAENCFITLTYAPEHLPQNASLVPKHLTDFIKRLRERIKPKLIKYFACGEYGHSPSTGNIERPHYHLCLFGMDFTDKKFFFNNKLEQPVYRSNLLESVWTFGHSTVAEFTFETAGYTARYTLKKQTEQEKFEHVNVDLETGAILEQAKYERIMRRKGIQPEFIRMSKGLGKNWLEKYRSDTDKDYIVSRNRKQKIPRYYDKENDKHNPEKHRKIKEVRVQKAKERSLKTTKSELKSREIINKQNVNLLKRGYDNGS